MKTKPKQFWKDLEGELFHVLVTDVSPYGASKMVVSGKVIELNEMFDFEVYTEED